MSQQEQEPPAEWNDVKTDFVQVALDTTNTLQSIKTLLQTGYSFIRHKISLQREDILALLAFSTIIASVGITKLSASFPSGSGVD